ncbi:MAG: putative 2-dehydropantoate 2-reductase [Spirulina sp. SIO3F2]|nr:putative 2-dehydropantoate 2-reductase [Spirulina sp. SIO3F2]
MAQRRYAVVGTGAIGGYYGACLQRAGFEVHFLLRSDYDWVREQGLRIDSVYGDFVLSQVNAYVDPAAMPQCDGVIIALKSTQNAQLVQILPPLIGPHTTIVLLQNGLGCETAIASQFPDNPLLGGLCFVCANKVGPGHIRHLDYQAITLGQYAPDYVPCGITPELEAIAQDFAAAKIEIHPDGHLLQSRWRKLVWNIPYNGLSVILDATTDALMAHPPTKQLVTEIMQEVQQGAAAWDCEIADAFIEQMLTHTEQMTPYLTSMKLDAQQGRPLEHEAIVGEPWRWAAARGVDLPRIGMIYRQLAFCDRLSQA